MISGNPKVQKGREKVTERESGGRKEVEKGVRESANHNLQDAEKGKAKRTNGERTADS